MQVTINPSIVSGQIQSPPSKSQTIRAIAGAMLAKGVSVLSNASHCEDAQAMIEIAKKLGAKISIDKEIMTIAGGDLQFVSEVNCSESGVAARLMIALSALSDQEITITGSGSLMRRHLGDIQKSMGELRVTCESDRGFLPVKIRGPVMGNMVTVDGNSGSQLLSGLLMALPNARHDVLITVENLRSAPYLEMTIEMMERFGVAVKRLSGNRFLTIGNQNYHPVNLKIEGDWSGAAFLMVAAAINGNLTIKGLNPQSTQADKVILSLFQTLGINFGFDGDCLTVRQSTIPPFNFDCTDCPDLFPPLTALAAYAAGVCRINGVERLAHKESHRSLTLQSEFAKLGVKIIIENNELVIFPGIITGGSVFSHNDHRIAMACAVAALKAASPVIIENAECVNKSYPSFFDDLSNAGAKILIRQ
jgi:3-phosphoshikimate 1-carboxyvinyltransferase